MSARKASKRSTKPVATKKPVAYRLGANTHKVASATKRGAIKTGRAVAGFFKNVAAGWRAA